MLATDRVKEIELFKEYSRKESEEQRLEIRVSNKGI
jgi:hypothetical protein